MKGGPFGDIKKFSKKSRTVPKKIQNGGPFTLIRFCRLRLKSKKKPKGETKNFRKSHSAEKNRKGEDLTVIVEALFMTVIVTVIE